MKKILYLIIFLPSISFANHESLINFCNSLDDDSRDACLINSEYIWKNIGESDVSYCSQFDEEQSNICLEISGCSDHKPKNVMECLVDTFSGHEKPCSHEAVRIYIESSQTCNQRKLEYMNQIIEDWEVLL